MKHGVVILLLLLLAPAGWGAVYYVSPTGSNTSPYDTWAKAANLPSTAVTAGNTDTGGDGPHTLTIMAATYAETVTLTDADWSGATVGGTGGTVVIAAPAADSIVTGSNCDNVTLQDLTIMATGANRALNHASGSTGWLGQRLILLSDATHTGDLVLCGGASMDFTSCTFRHKWSNDKNALKVGIGWAGTVRNCLFEPAPGAASCGGFYSTATGTQNLYNCDFLGCGWAAVYFNRAEGTLNVKNCVLQGCNETSAMNTIRQIAGAVNLTNSMVYANPWVPGGFITGSLATDTGNIYTNADPKFTAQQRVGYIILSFDDNGFFADIRTATDVVASYGFKATYVINPATWDAEDTPALRAMVAAGNVEVASHGSDHTQVNYEYALRCTYAGADTGDTVALTAGGVIQFRTTEHNDEFDLDTTAAAYDTLGEIEAADQANWTIAKSTTGSQDATHISDECSATVLAAQAATPAPCDILFDDSGYESGLFKWELVDSIAAIEAIVNGGGNITDPQTGVTYACRTYASPYGGWAADCRAAAIAAGYLLARGPVSESEPASVDSVVDIDLFSMEELTHTTYLRGADEAATRQNARAIAVAAIQGGLAIHFMCHGLAGFSEQEWGWACDEWSKFGDRLVVTSQQVFADTVRAAPWTDDGDGTYSRTYATYTDYRLLNGSPAINAGTDVGLTTDYAGTAVPQGALPDMGAYEFEFSGGTLFHSGIFGGSVLQ